MPIIRHGYAKHTRSGSTRAYRKERARVLAQAMVCSICGMPATRDDPFESHHIEAYADSGIHAGNLAPAHQSCNRRLGRAGRGRGVPREG